MTGVRGARYLLLAYPLVQSLRFVTKIILGLLLGVADFGEVMQVGILIFFASHFAYAGLDEALVAADRLDRRTFARLRRFHVFSGLLAAVLAALAGAVLAWLLDRPSIQWLALGLAPMIALANVSVLPMALLVRQRRYRDAFWVDVAATIGLALATVYAAWLGAGAWSLVAGWYMNALIVVLLAERLARPSIAALPDDPAAGATAPLRSHGRRFLGSSVIGFLAQRADAFLVGAVLGPIALGLYELAQYLAQAFAQYAVGLGERYLFPLFSDERRGGRLAPTFGHALRIALVFVLPGHVLLALVARPFVLLVFPDAWQGLWPILSALAIAAAFQCLELVPVNALKGAGWTHSVLRLSVIRVLLIMAAVLVSLRSGSATAVAVAVAAARAVSFAASLVLARHVIRELEPRHEFLKGIGTVLGWGMLLLPVVYLLDFASDATGAHSLLLLSVEVASATALWILVRIAWDRAAFQREWQFVYRRVAAALVRGGT